MIQNCSRFVKRRFRVGLDGSIDHVFHVFDGEQSLPADIEES